MKVYVCVVSVTRGSVVHELGRALKCTYPATLLGVSYSSSIGWWQDKSKGKWRSKMDGVSTPYSSLGYLHSRNIAAECCGEELSR